MSESIRYSANPLNRFTVLVTRSYFRLVTFGDSQ